MIDEIGITDKISTLSLSGLVIFALVGSYFKKWCWYSVVNDLNAVHTATITKMEATHAATITAMKSDCETASRHMQADYEQRLVKYEASNNKWEKMALRGVGLAEVGIGLAKKGES